METILSLVLLFLLLRRSDCIFTQFGKLHLLMNGYTYELIEMVIMMCMWCMWCLFERDIIYISKQKKRKKIRLFAECRDYDIRQTSIFVDLEPIFAECHHKALDKLAHFAECPSQGTRQTCPLCRVSRRYYTRQSSRHRYPSVPLAFFCRGLSRHSAKCLPSARQCYPFVPLAFFCRGPSRHSAKCLPSAR